MHRIKNIFRMRFRVRRRASTDERIAPVDIEGTGKAVVNKHTLILINTHVSLKPLLNRRKTRQRHNQKNIMLLIE